MHVGYYLGDEPDTEDSIFVVHESTIRQRSRFFDNALKRGWKEAEHKVVRLPEAESDAFELYVNWLYSSQLYTKGQSDEDEYGQLVEAYVLGDWLQDPDYKDAVIDALIDKIKDDPILPTGLAGTIWAHTAPGSSLRELVTDVYLSDDEDWEEKMKGIGLEALQEIIAARMNSPLLLPPKMPYLVESCTYHEHKKAGKECYKVRLLGLDVD